MNVKSININTVNGGEKGSLSFFEAGKDIDFKIQRVYYTYSAKLNTKRGGHAHKKLKQLLFCVYGKIKVILDDGNERIEKILDNESKGLIVNQGIWRDIIWLEENSVLCVAASELYDESDYIRNYDDYIKFVNRRLE